MKLRLKVASSQDWLNAVLKDFDRFLLDHAANEKKAAGVALNLAAHYLDKPDLVAASIDLAIEELSHYREVVKLIRDRQLILVPDRKDPYVNQLRQMVRHGRQAYFLDRLLVAAIVESRGQERFTKIAEALPPGDLQGFYQLIAQSEARHGKLFLTLAQQYCDATEIEPRLEELLDHEARILDSLMIQSALH